MLTLAAVNTTLIDLVRWIPVIAFGAMLVAGLMGTVKPLRKMAAVVTILATLAGLVLSLLAMAGMGDLSQFTARSVPLFQWIHIGSFNVDISFFVDPLTIVMLLVVTGVGTLIAIYAAGYMAGDPGYFRFFAYFALFIFAMTTLVMADNLLLLYLGWEGVGLASYLLIGFYYRKPSAAAAAKKAFIVNRIGDFGFALGLMGVFVVFGAVGYSTIIPAAQLMNEGLASGIVSASQSVTASMASAESASHGLLLAIPFLLMLGAFGKSAQLPLHVWLPDAMEGPTPVSALIHAATMVTAGVYMIARLLPIFQLSPYALPTVAIIGGITALFAATIAVAQYDIKRVWAYSTVSQLGYMFLGVGVLGTFGAVFHLFTHAFFKALLFLTAGNVMHALAGQLDMRRFSGMFRKMPVTGVLMLIGCLALAGFPFTAGYYSKDQILVDALVHPTLGWLGWIGIATALLTAFYTFRLWFGVFMGETKFEMGHEHHGYETDHPPDDHAHGPHEMGWLMNGPLVVLAVGALVAGLWLGGKKPGEEGWMYQMVSHSTAAADKSPAAHNGHATGDVHAPAEQSTEPHGAVPVPAVDQAHAHDHAAHDATHTMVSWLAGGGAIVMILLAGYFHWVNTSAGEAVVRMLGPIVTLFNRKWYVDELYHAAIVLPLRALAWVCYLFDRVVIDGIVSLIAWLPRGIADVQRPAQAGRLQGYALSMCIGIGLIIAIVLFVVVL